MIDAAVAIVITEIMYNPASNEKQPVKVEWVELYNRSDEPVDLSGWKLADEDGESAPIPDNAILPGGQALVLIPDAQDPRAFRSAWPQRRGEQTYPVLQLDGWRRGGFGGLSNQPSPTNEVLSLRRPDDSIADLVNFDDTDPWPTDTPEGPSIYLLPHAIDPDLNDDGRNWARSEPRTHQARNAFNRAGYSELDIGSPGVVEIDPPEDAPEE
ncbi:MAG: lamin tail domain-containing protein [Phycisphaeraceae bacterium]